MSCIITYKGNKYTQEQFKEYISNNKNEFSHIIASNKNVIDSFKRKMEGIDYVFSQSPELASIGNKAQYLQYLSTIFKTSKVKDIVYHSTPFEFDTFKKPSTVKENIYNQHLIDDRNPEKIIPDAIYFQFQPKSFRKGRIIAAIINSKELIKKENYSGYSIFYTVGNRQQLEEQLNSKTFDALDISPLKDKRELLVFEPEQIHVLASKADIEGFKEFVNNNNQKTKDYFSNEINKIQEESKIIENSLKEYETSKKIDNRNTTKAIKNKEEKTKETNNKLLSLGFEFINENEYQFSTSSYITFKSKLNSLEGIDVSINTFKSPDYLIKIKIAPLKNNFDLQKQGELPFNPIELKLALKENDFIQDIADNTFEGLTEEQINILRDNLENGELNLNCKI